jgi:uncharacterized protein YlxW (UPF0749 family)
MNLKHGIWAVAVAAAMGSGGFAVQAVAAAFQDQDYAKNKTYEQGRRDGQADQVKKMDHSKKRRFKKDEDRKAYEAGYQKGRGN